MKCPVCGESPDLRVLHSDCIDDLEKDIVLLSYPPKDATDQLEIFYRFEYDYYAYENFEHVIETVQNVLEDNDHQQSKVWIEKLEPEPIAEESECEVIEETTLSPNGEIIEDE